MIKPTTSAATRFVLGLDPGLGITGYGIIAIDGMKIRLIEAGVLRMNPRDNLEDRLLELHAGVREVIALHPIEAVAIEQLYSHYQRPRTAVLMGHARGVLCLAAAEKSLGVHSYEPTKVKKTLTGNGHASKSQMQLAVQYQLRLKIAPEPADVADALAVAICHNSLSWLAAG